MSAAKHDFIDIGEGCTRDPRLVTDWDGSQFYYEFTPTMNDGKLILLAAAAKLASKCNLLGGGWSVPQDPDPLLRGIVWSEKGPCVVPAWKADTKTNYWYLTSCKHPSNPDYVRVVYFGYGFVSHGRRDDSGYVRFVRRVPASQ